MGDKKTPEDGPIFIYEATDGTDRVIKGTSHARSEAALRKQLASKGYRVTRIERAPRPARTAEQQSAYDDAIKRVAQVILEQGIKDSAASIKVLLTSRQQSPIQVRYLIGDQWHEVMAVPGYVWEPLCARLASMAGITLASPFKRQTGAMQFEHDDTAYDFAVVVNRKSIRVDTGLGSSDNSG